jgi:hypothetical protein
VHHPPPPLSVAIGVGLVLFAVACSSTPPLTARTDFAAEDPRIARLLLEAAAEWAALGVAAASLVTVNEVADAVRIRAVPKPEVVPTCHFDPSRKADGCSLFHDNRWNEMIVADNLTDERLRLVLMHELGHILASFRGHVPDPDGTVRAVMSSNGTSLHPTEADREYMAAHTLVLDPADLA